MKEESTKIKDEIRISRKTDLVPFEITSREIPSSRVFDVRYYKDRLWVLIFMDRETFESLKTLCEARGLDVKKVVYGSIMKTRDLLREEAKKNGKEKSEL